MKKMLIPIRIAIDLELPLIDFDPAKDLAETWQFEDRINGPSDNDGIKSLSEAMVKAATLPKEEGHKLLFASGVQNPMDRVSRETRIERLSEKKLADPYLLWILYKEEGQKTLRYLHDTYGVIWLEALRRTFKWTACDGVSVFIYLRRNDGPDGAWQWYCDYTGLQGGQKEYVLILEE